MGSSNTTPAKIMRFRYAEKHRMIFIVSSLDLASKTMRYGASICRHNGRSGLTHKFFQSHWDTANNRYVLHPVLIRNITIPTDLSENKKYLKMIFREALHIHGCGCAVIRTDDERLEGDDSTESTDGLESEDSGTYDESSIPKRNSSIWKHSEMKHPEMNHPDHPFYFRYNEPKRTVFMVVNGRNGQIRYGAAICHHEGSYRNHSFLSSHWTTAIYRYNNQPVIADRPADLKHIRVYVRKLLHRYGCVGGFVPTLMRCEDPFPGLNPDKIFDDFSGTNHTLLMNDQINGY